ncbi:MAG TPA: lytic transglycosylase domain-containing protein, partial [Acetobacteraceae bacterium]|nr:lytic transglycosylase domain-containing protein [Acetobacteraceae bacterium]
QAVAVARRAGRDGIALPGVGWPEPVEPPSPVERAVALGLIRQESSFDAQALSPAGARGLMQLMPATATQVARRLNEPVASLTDAVFNMRLGTAYLHSLLGRFAALPAALAAYNAGPSRVQEWLAANGDPASGAVDPIDWVELIPFNETRNYVQRVVENVVLYRARQGLAAPHPVLRWLVSGT